MQRCSRCNKPLLDPVSIERKYGPICWSKQLGIEALRASEKMRHIERPITDGIILARDPDGRIATNVEWSCISGSPDGFEWGYGGSGPADLALNICEQILCRLGYQGERTRIFKNDCFELAYKIRNEFKRKFIVPMAREGGVIDYRAALKFITDALERETHSYQVTTFNPPNTRSE